MKQNDAPTCPRDASTLAAQDDAGFRSLRCGRCAGLFVEQATLVRSLPQSPLSTSDGKPLSLGALPKGDLACATCAEPMLRLVHKGVEIDVCRFCRAFWLDAGEWERIAKPASSKGSKFGRVQTLTAGAAAAGVAAATVATVATAAAAAPPPIATSSVAGDIVGTVAEGAGEFAIELVVNFIGEAIGSIF